MKSVLLVNLGTPQAPTREAVGAYLVEFLSDPLVVDLPRWLWIPLLRLFIVPLRRRRTAEAYAEIWTAQGSPLLVGSARLCEALEKNMRPVGAELAMRYGEPAIGPVLKRLQDAGTEELVVVPLYPQFSDTTTRSVLDEVDRVLKEMNWFPRVLTVSDYHDDSGWVRAVADSVREFQQRRGRPDKLMFSLHGIPQRYSDAGDPYRLHCERSVELIAAELGLDPGDYLLTYQSRVGREPWLQPYTDETLKQWAEQGVRHVQVVCPGFAIDCIETLEEIAMQNRRLFEKAGGEKLEYIPALNDSDRHVQVLASLVNRALEI